MFNSHGFLKKFLFIKTSGMCKGFNIEMVRGNNKKESNNLGEENSEFHEMKSFEYFPFLFCLLKNSKVEEKQKKNYSSILLVDFFLCLIPKMRKV